MSARAIINTPREDREGDIIIPQGVQLDNYRNNPVVLWEHGLGEISRPIAKCQHPDGTLALEVSENEISAISFFTDKCLESLQIFHLIAEGLVRATSVRALPIKSAIRKTSNAGTGIILEAWELIEWSWGALGVNPDAIARTLDRGTIEGRKITQPLLKSLQAVLPQDSMTIPGWSKTDPVEPGNCSTVKRSDVPNQSPEPEQPGHDSKIKRQQTCSPSPLGAQLLRSISASITELTERLHSIDTLLENQQIQKHLKTFLTTLQSEQDGLNELYAEVCRHIPPDHEELKISEGTAALQVPDQIEIPSWLNQEQSQQTLKDHARRDFEAVSNTLSLSGDQRQLITELFKELKHQDDQVTQARNQNLERHVEELSQSLAVLQRKICDLIPAR